MESLELRSYAKVNLTLDVLEKRPSDGYHYIRSIMVPISLADTVTLELADQISLESDVEIPGAPEANLAWRAADLLRRVTGYSSGVRISLNKTIPIAGGLAGGSTNGAAVLVGLNRLWGLGLSPERLVDMAIRLGSDVPFFVPGKPARVEGIGEVLTPIQMHQPITLVVATPAVAKSTGNVYKQFDELTAVQRPDSSAMEAALASGNLQAVSEALGNVFEQVMLPRHPEIGRLKAAMVEAGAMGALMSGAGPTVFGIAPDHETGRHVLQRVRSIAQSAFLAQTIM